jgi:hypothetical protein
MPIKPNDLEGVLTNKLGFVPSRHHSSDHRWYELTLPDLPTIKTKVSHSRKPINPKIESMIARQLRVRLGFFKEVVACTKSREAYYEQVRENPQPPFEVQF